MPKAKLLILILLSCGQTHATSLKDLLQLAEQHPQYQVKRNTLRAAAKIKTKSYTEFLPQLNATYESAENTETDVTTKTTALNAQINLFNGFKDFSEILAQRANYKKEEFRFASEKNKLEHEISCQYLKCVYQEKNIQQSQSSVQIRQQIAEIADLQFKKGIKPQDDAIKLGIDFENAKAVLQKSKSRFEQCLLDLKFWNDTISAVAEPNFLELQKKIETPLNDWSQQPDIQSSFFDAEKYKYQARGSYSQWLPKVNLTFSALPKTNYQAEENLFLINAEWSIFDYNQQWIQAQLSNIAQETAHLIHQNTVNEVRLNSLRLLSEYQSLKEQYKIYLSNYNAAQKLLDSSLRRFRAGSISANEVALDQTRLIETSLLKDEYWLLLNLSIVDLATVRGDGIKNHL